MARSLPASAHHGSLAPGGHRAAGFTLVEVLVCLALVAVLLVAGTDLLWQMVSARLRSAATLEVQQNAGIALARIAVEIRGAHGLVQGSGQSVFGSHPGQLTLDYPGVENDVVVDTAPAVVTVAGQTVTIRKLRVSRGGGPALALTSDRVDVADFVVWNLTRVNTPQTVRIALTIAAVNPGHDPNRRATSTLETSVTLRR